MLAEHRGEFRSNAHPRIVKGSFREELTLPSLFWRIDEAEQARQGRGASLAVYRAEVLRNLRWLLNASAAREADPIWDHARAAESVLNFGIPPYSGRVGTSMDADQMAAAIHSAILRFEPRILAGTLMVEKISGEDPEGNSIAFRITGSIWSQPVPERFAMETTVDTASGEWSFNG